MNALRDRFREWAMERAVRCVADHHLLRTQQLRTKIEVLAPRSVERRNYENQINSVFEALVEAGAQALELSGQEIARGDRTMRYALFSHVHGFYCGLRMPPDDEERWAQNMIDLVRWQNKGDARPAQPSSVLELEVDAMRCGDVVFVSPADIEAGGFDFYRKE